MATGPFPQSTLGRIARRVIYSLVVCAIILFVVDRAADFVEQRRWLKLDTIDSATVYLSHPPYVRQGGEYITNPLVRDTLVASRFRATKGDAWRMFVLGESFAMGTPYVHQAQSEPHHGGISSWLSADLQALFPSRLVEIINAAAGAQNSGRVRQIAQEVMRLQPDALLVATCNNEGVLPPAAVDEILRKTDGYRLLARLVVPEGRPDERSYFTAQDPNTDAIRANFKRNLQDILAAARSNGVPVLLCTMPVNLRYDGTHKGHVAPELEAVEPALGDCTREAMHTLRHGNPTAAIEALRRCNIDLEGLRVLGLALYAAAEYREAHAMLSMYTELVPRNRCRPSLNRIIREQAQAAPGVHLVDLEAAAEALSPGGVPGTELFIDYCHMNWAGYAAMADVVLKAMREHGIMPGNRPHDESLLPQAELLRRFGLSDVDLPVLAPKGRR